jgi:hypothetical protein
MTPAAARFTSWSVKGSDAMSRITSAAGKVSALDRT